MHRQCLSIGEFLDPLTAHRKGFKLFKSIYLHKVDGQREGFVFVGGLCVLFVKGVWLLGKGRVLFVDNL
jgi:hypothetical protein